MMISTATDPGHSPHNRRPPSASVSRPLLAISGSLIALMGAALALISSLSSLDAQWFFLLAGIGLILSGALLAKRHIAGAWTYLAVFAATLGWSLQGAAGGSSVAYRILGPIIMLCMLALLMPALRRWSRARTLGVLSALIIATIMIGDWSATADEPLDAPIIARLESPHIKEVLR